MTGLEIAGFSFGVFFVIALLVIAFLRPNPTPFQEGVFRTVLSLSASGVAVAIPGLLNVELSPSSNLVITATGVIGVFFIVYFINPARFGYQFGQLPIPIGGSEAKQREYLELAKEQALKELSKTAVDDARARNAMELKIQSIENDLEDTKKAFAEKEKVLEELQKTLLENKSIFGEDRTERALEKLKSGYVDEAKMLLSEGIECDPNNRADHAYRLAQIHRSENNLTQAIEAVGQAVSFDKTEWLYLSYKAELEFEAGLLSDARQSYERCLELFGEPGALFGTRFNIASIEDFMRLRIARFYIFIKEHDRARSLLEPFLDGDMPRDDLPDAFAEKLLEVKQYLDSDLGGITAIPEHPVSDQISEQAVSEWNQRGHFQKQQGEYQEALASFQKALDIYYQLDEKDPTQGGICNINLGDTLCHLGDYTASRQARIAAAEELGELHPFILNSAIGFGEIADSQSDFIESVSFYEEALRIGKMTEGAFSPIVINTYQKLAQAYVHLGEFRKAHSIFQSIYEQAQDGNLDGLRPSDVDDLRKGLDDLQSLIGKEGD